MLKKKIKQKITGGNNFERQLIVVLAQLTASYSGSGNSKFICSEQNLNSK